MRDLFDQNQLSMRPGRQLIVSDSIHLDSPTVNIAQDSVASNHIGHGIPSNLTSASGDTERSTWRLRLKEKFDRFSLENWLR